MSDLVIQNTFTPSTKAIASEVNTNFSDIKNYINARNSGGTSWDTLNVAGAAVLAGANTFSGTNTLSGNSTFIGDAIFKKTPWFDVRAFGAVGDGTTDDSAAINSAITALPTEGGVIFFPSGTFIVGSPISVKSNTTIVGSGMKTTVIKLKNNVLPGAGASGGMVIKNANLSVVGSTDQNIEIRDLTIDGNKANNTEVNPGSNLCGISFGYATDCRLYRVEIKNTDGIAALYFGNTISGSETSNRGIIVKDCVIRGAVSTIVGGSYGAAMFITAPQTVKSIVESNYVYDCRYGIMFEDSPAESSISMNQVEALTANTTGIGIWVNSGSGTGNRSRSNRIIGNYIKNYGVGITQSGDIGTSNVYCGNIVESAYTVGVSIETGGSATDVNKKMIFSNNIVKNTRNGMGIHVGSATTQVSIIGNHSFDDQAIPTQTYGLGCDATTSYLSIYLNNFIGNVTAGATILGTRQAVGLNQGYNSGFTEGAAEGHGVRLYDDGVNSAIYGGYTRGTGALNFVSSSGTVAMQIASAATVNFLSGTSGVTVGAAPTGGDKGTGTINVSGGIYRNNTAYTNPDYALEHWATGKIEKFINNQGAQEYPGRMKIEELEKYMKEKYQLPGVGSKREIFDRSDILLEKVEEAFTYIVELNKRIKDLESK